MNKGSIRCIVGRIFCAVGLHKWENKDAPTLRCVRCPKTVCLWAIGLRNLESYTVCRNLEGNGTRCVLQQDYKPRCPCVDYEARRRFGRKSK